MIKAELANISGGSLQYEPGGFRVQVDTRPASGNNFGKKKYKGGGGNRNFQGPNTGGGNNYNKNRKFKNKNKGGGGM